MKERVVEIHLIAEYKFDATIDTMPTFHEGYPLEFIDTYDTDNGDGTITRTLHGVKPRTISFAGCTGLLEVTKICIAGDSYIELFDGCTNLTYVNMNNWINDSVTHTGSMFKNCTSLETIDMEDWDKPNLVNISSMFYGCSSLTEIDLSNWDVTKFTNMSSLFDGCVNLRNIFMLNWNSSNCENMQRLFADCNIELLDFSSWDFSSVTSMLGMVGGCESLKSMIFDNINLNKINTTDKMSSSALDSLENVIIKNSTATNINKLIEILPPGDSALNCKIYLPLTQDMSKINVAAANAKGWKVTQGGIVYNISKVLNEDTVVFEYDGISEGRSTCFAPTFGCACGVKIADVTEEETAMYKEAIQNNGCIITYDTGDGVIIEETTHEVSSFNEGTIGILTNNRSNLVLMFSPKAWSWYYAHVDQYVNDPGVYILQNQLNNDTGYNNDKFRCLKVEILGLKSTKIARLKRGEFINDTIKKTVVGEVPNITYK